MLLACPPTAACRGGGGYSQALKDAIDRAAAADILFIAAAGNGGSDGAPWSLQRLCLAAYRCVSPVPTCMLTPQTAICT